MRAGQTIAATYPAAVIGMAVLRAGQRHDSRREHRANRRLDRRRGGGGRGLHHAGVCHGEAVARRSGFADAYWKSTALMLVGSVLGVLFVSLVRRVLVEDPELPFPESVAASQIHKAGQVGAQAAKYLFYNMAFGAATFLLGAFNLFAPDKDFFFPWASWTQHACGSAARDPRRC